LVLAYNGIPGVISTAGHANDTKAEGV
jgi:hypothetical protein